ncbi:L-aspartate oxidase [Anaerovirgula multivorans]|uniref:L-aspartate oxidase n=1 Tax=Anaerovirgula multivorans TaxID=312168 RepID=A0A239J798_9FIRM|nr:L-aspartate oxidase [Anaerovirgula multivorans]SNT01737.1 L-aspartate oxidase [Anaerovirgula multivorans]
MNHRYVTDFNMEVLKKVNSDIVIVGTGIAGLFTALNINPKYKVTLISKATLEKNNSQMAQGGIAVSIDKEIHFQDTLKAGGYCNNLETLKILVDESTENIHKLMFFGVNFDKDEKGNLKLAREGGHSQNSILHVKDATGKEIVKILSQQVRERRNIEIDEDIFVLDILTEGNTAKGIVVINKEGEKLFYKGKAVVIATGGIGQIYKNTTNDTIATGDGIAMAYRASAEIGDMEFIQFHPTAFYSAEGGQCFLISEAVRGEGGILRNHNGEAFMEKYHEMQDLAPRDIVARSIFTEMKKNHKPFVYLDITHKSSDFIKNRFPTIYNYCLSKGVDMTKNYIPIAPVEHYVMGGILTNKEGKTNIEGLYACGECACTGIHGSNRLASNSLLEGIVFGNRVANAINQFIPNYKKEDSVFSHYNNPKKPIDQKETPIEIHFLRKDLKNIMQQQVCIVRSKAELENALEAIKEIKDQLMKYREDNMDYYELNNMVTVAMLIIKAALKRKKSIGSHYLVG